MSEHAAEMQRRTDLTRLLLPLINAYRAEHMTGEQVAAVDESTTALLAVFKQRDDAIARLDSALAELHYNHGCDDQCVQRHHPAALSSAVSSEPQR